ncbi:MAG: DUF3100 domain-containing protein [Lawsonibacter sp.]|jgi:hypothetical protein
MNTQEQSQPKMCWTEYKLHLAVLAVVLLAELVVRKVTLTFSSDTYGSLAISFQPFVFAMILGLAAYLLKPLKWVGEHESEAASGTMLIFVGPLLAKLAVASGYSINEIIAVGPAMILQEFGNIGTMFLALPVALLLGFKREAVGMTHSIGREQNMGLIIDRYGFDSDETRGVLIIYIIGTVIGSVFIGPLTTVLATLLPLSPLAYAMATGVGSAGMTAASLSTLIDMFPEYETQMSAYSSMSNLLTQVDGIYVSIFIGLPLCNVLYRVLEPTLGRLTRTGRENARRAMEKEGK